MIPIKFGLGPSRSLEVFEKIVELNFSQSKEKKTKVLIYVPEQKKIMFVLCVFAKW